MDNFLRYYEGPETRPVFETVDDMLKWAGLYNLTTRTLQEELIDIKLSPLLIEELITVRNSMLDIFVCLCFIDVSGYFVLGCYA